MVKRIFHHVFSLRTLSRWLTDQWPLFLLIIIVAVLSFLNYQPGTILTGWDNLHPEFNLGINLKNTIFSVWQERGTGFLAGMAQAAELPRIAFLVILESFGARTADLRYLWTFLALAIGPISTYLLLHHIFLKPKFDSQTKRVASFLGALFYLLNLATIQYFFIPFESFSAFFAFFPLILLATTLYFERASLRHYLFLLFILIIATPAFFVQTLFVVTALCLIPIIFSLLGHSLKKIAIFLLTLLATQSYWLFPQIFFVLTHAGQVGLAHANLLSSPETLYRNLEFANLKDLTLLKGYWFNILDPSSDNKFDYLFLVWRNHLSNPIIATIGFLAFALVVTGIVYSLKKRLPFAKAFFSIFLICNFFLLGGVQFVGNSIPVLGELFRSPFTKFSIPLAFTYSVFFSVGVIFLFDIFSFLHHRLTYFLTFFTIATALIIFTTPAFTGNLISPFVRVRTPSDYFELFDFFKSQDPSTRIANFPQYVLWGWNYYSWGYRGAGFLWYGIKQPLLDRGFDVWEMSSEKYYEEISAAIYSEDQKSFENLIDKYAINWLLIDKNVVAASSETDLGFGKIQKFLENNPRISLVKNINNNLFIYKTNLDRRIKNFLSLSAPITISQPFIDLPLRPFVPQITNDFINLKSKIINQKSINIPSYSQTENLTPYAITYRKLISGVELRFQPIAPVIKLDGVAIDNTPNSSFVTFNFTTPQSGLILAINDQYYEIQLPDELGAQAVFYPLTTTYLPSRLPLNLALYQNTPSYKLDLTSALSQATPYQCFTNKPNRKIEKITTQNSISLFGIDLVGCLSAPIPQPTDPNQLLSLEFTYSSPVGTPGNANLTDTSLGGLVSPQPLIAKKQFAFTRVFAKPLLRPLQANLILEANEAKSTQEIDYKNIQVGYLPLLGENVLIPNSLPAKTIKNLSSKNISIEIPILDSQITNHTDVQNNNLNPEASNCDNFNSGKFIRETTPNGLLYQATNANSCDQINLKNFPHNTNYAIIADITNHSGLLPTICLENHSTRRCDVFERLIDGQQLIIQPVSNPNEPPGYTLHLANQSFGDPPDENLIKSISISPFPYNFLKNITTNSSPEFTNHNSYLVNQSSHPAEFLYLLKATNSADQALNLYQTQSPYWKALEVSEGDLDLPLWLLIAKIPHLYFFGPQTNRLTRTDSDWYNSWNLPACPPKCEAFGVVIFYLPQYLEFIGFLLLPLPLIGILFYTLIRNSAKG